MDGSRGGDGGLDLPPPLKTTSGYQISGMDPPQEAIVSLGSNCFSREVNNSICSSVKYVDDLKKVN